MKRIIYFAIVLALALSLFVVAASAAGDDAATSNFFESIFDEMVKHSDEILSALCFAGSVILAFTYRRGLIPTVKGAIDKLSEGVGAIRKESEEHSDSSLSALARAGEGLEKAECMLVTLSERLSALEESLSALNEGENQKEVFRILMLSQTDMLYDIFMTSSLPQYQKDIVGEKIAAMKESLKAKE